jgi:Na+-driven multidrug efflux pump
MHRDGNIGARAGAGSTRVANELGSGQSLRAKRAAKSAICLEAVLMLIVVAIGIALKDVWSYMFTDDPEASSQPCLIWMPALARAPAW